MKILKKNQIVIYLVAIMLMSLAYLNYTTNVERTAKQASTETIEENTTNNIGDARLVSSEIAEVKTENKKEAEDEYFAKSKLERDTMYSQTIESYEKILNSPNSLETQRQSATEEITRINEIKNSVMICENLIRLKGFENNIIFVNGDNVSVIVKAENIEQDKIAQIQNIISREMKAEIDNIHISNK